MAKRSCREFYPRYSVMRDVASQLGSIRIKLVESFPGEKASLRQYCIKNTRPMALAQE